MINRKVNGIFLLDKPLNMTSNGALQRVKRLFGAKKAGHTGSLDPLATGMLPLCFGDATKFSQYLLESDKYYRVTVKLGIKTTTGDAEGEITVTRPVVNITLARLEEVLAKFTGKNSQIPPMFSAIKYKGQPLYKLARQGLEVERKARDVYIHRLQLIEFHTDTFIFEVHCSKGTYIRTLVEDIGEVLGCGGYVTSLRRVAVAPYQNTKMWTLLELEEAHKTAGMNALMPYLIPIETAVESYPAIKLSLTAAFYIRSGQPVMVPHLPVQGYVRIFSDDNEFMGIGEVLDDGRVTPRRLLTLPKKMANNSACPSPHSPLQ